MNIRRIYIAGLFLLLFGCQVTKNYQGAEPSNQVEAFPLEELSTDSVSMAEMTIEMFFDDERLIGLIRTGLEHNYNLAQALKSIDIAQAYYLQGKAAYYPSLSANPQVAYSMNSRNTAFGNIEGVSRVAQSYRLGVDASWEADLWGKLKSQERMAYADLQAAQLGLQGIQTELISNIASLYYQLIGLDARKEIAERTIHNRRSSLETIEALKSAGDVTEVAVQQNRAQLHFAEALLVDIKENIFLLENTLNALLARPYQPVERSSWEDVSLPEYLSTGLPAELLENRPDLRQAEAQIRGDFEQINVAQTFFYPALILNASTGFESIKINNFLNPASIFANIAGGLSQPILDRRQNKTRLEVAQIQFEQSMLQYEELYLNAIKEVTDALKIAEKAEEKLQYQLAEFDARTKALDFSGELLNYGRANYLEVLVAQDQVLATELGMIDTEMSRISAVVSLYKALGGGWGRNE